MKEENSVDLRRLINIILNKFFSLKIRSKFFISYLFLLVLAVIAISIPIFKIYENDKINSSVKYSQELAKQISYNLGYNTKDLEDNILLKVRGYNNLFDDLNSGEYNSSKRLFDFLFNITYSKKDVQEIYIESIEGNYHIFSKNNDSEEENKLINYANKERKNIVSSLGAVEWFTLTDSPNSVFMSRAILDVDTLRVKGNIIVGVSKDYFSEIYKSFGGLENGELVIFFGEGNLIYDDGNKIIQKDYLENYIFPNKNILDNYITYNGEKYLIGYSSSANNRWTILNIISEKQLFYSVNIMRNAILFICIIFLIIAFFIALFISKGMSSNIRILHKNIMLLRKGNFDIKISPKNSDEIGDLALEFNKMVSQLNDLINRVSDEKVAKEKAEYKALQAEFNALQAQMNPHFLYNVLEAINSLAKIEGQKTISEVVTKLGTILRTSLSNKNRIISLEEELHYVKNYLDIQKVMLEDRIEIEFDIDDGVLKYSIPKLILQPIVENSIVHGMSNMTDIGVIVISAYKDSNLTIKVSDNGCGIDKNILLRLLNDEIKEEYSNNNHTRIGIKSVNKRIKILYGENYGLKIYSEKNIGTTVEIILPADEGEKLI